ncbi:MAG: hypothetical protein FJ115_02020 [Deltaproteobacteria bacterium]|nr:hypothetical protein [Deltaproteobacteria bacterium]MBM4322312.1 hypothetical protein [Deltaproteobacteria bacterium]
MNKLQVIGKTILDNYLNGFFSLDQISKLTGISRKYVTDVLVVFSQEGLVRKIVKQKKQHIPGHSPRFSLTYVISNKKGLAQRMGPQLKENTVQDRMWSVIRNKSKVSGYFDLHDLVVLGGVKKGTARWYLKTLRKLGYIAQFGRGSRGAVWGLTGKYSGPDRPYPEYRKKAKKTARFKSKKGVEIRV